MQSVSLDLPALELRPPRRLDDEHNRFDPEVTPRGEFVVVAYPSVFIRIRHASQLRAVTRASDRVREVDAGTEHALGFSASFVEGVR